MITIRSNNLCKSIVNCGSDEIEHGIDHVLKINAKGIKIVSSSTSTEIADLTPLERASEQLEYLNIDTSGSTKNYKNVESIYQLANLKQFYLGKEKLHIELDRFPKLEKVGIHYSSKIGGLGDLPSLKSLIFISGYPKEDLSFISGLINLEVLHIYKSSKIKNLNHIKLLTNLKEFKVAFSNNLNPLVKIKSKSITKIAIEKCKIFTNLEPLSGCKSLKFLFATKVESLRFIKDLPNLIDLHFWECVDGDLTPIFRHNKLQKVNITTNKKHYSHSQKDIDDHLRQLSKN